MVVLFTEKSIFLYPESCFHLNCSPYTVSVLGARLACRSLSHRVLAGTGGCEGSAETGLVWFSSLWLQKCHCFKIGKWPGVGQSKDSTLPRTSETKGLAEGSSPFPVWLPGLGLGWGWGVLCLKLVCVMIGEGGHRCLWLLSLWKQAIDSGVP